MAMMVERDRKLLEAQVKDMAAKVSNTISIYNYMKIYNAEIMSNMHVNWFAHS